MRLSGKKILLGITGSIAAYKAVSLCRLLKSEGADVQVVMTPSAHEFITPLTLSVVSGKPVVSIMISEENTWNNHVALGLWADLFLVAPASANTISAFTNGTCDNLLQAVFLSARCPVMVAPAMDHDMFLHASTQKNLTMLRERGNLIIGPAKGPLASGLNGEGRMLEPEEIFDAAISFFYPEQPLKGKKILVNAGPTREPIDPVRYITNHSTGKMGIAVADALLKAGAEVHLVAGPVSVPVPTGIHLINVITADDMMRECTRLFPEMDAAILSAAVADYKPVTVAGNKIKKNSDQWSLELEKTGDVLLALGKAKKPGQVLVGFALETENEEEYARQKLEKKNLDFIVLNSLRDEGAGFGTDTNKVRLVFRDNTIISLPLLSKEKVAVEIVKSLVNLTHA